MKKMLFALPLLIAIFICACSLEKVKPFANAVHNTNALSATSELGSRQIELLKDMNVTHIEYIEPYDENTIYIIGARKDKSLPAREIVYAVCNLETEKISVLHSEIIPIDWAYNMDIYRNENGTMKLFTGQQILTIDDDKVLEVENVVDDHYEVFVHLEKNQMVFLDNIPPSLYYGTVGSDDCTIIYEAKETDDAGKKSVIFPYCPRLNKAGDKILYGTTLGDTSQYQTVAISSIEGALIAETEKLDINADFLDMLWYKDGFITLELTDSYEDSPIGLATILTQYDEKAQKIKKSVLNGMALICQRKFYAGTSLYAFAYKTDKARGIALWDMSLNKAYYVCDVDGYVLAPTVTPCGSKILWCNNGYLYVEKLELDKYEEIPTF